MSGSAWMVTVTVIYILAMIVLSWYVGKKMTNNETEFMIGGREFTPIMTAIGNGSILISGGYLPGIVMYGYMFGMGGMWFYLGWGTGALVALLCWAGFWRTTGAVTPTEWFEYRYGKGGRIAITFVVLLATLAIMGWQYVGAGGTVAGALGISTPMAILIIGVAVTLYVALGGIWAATATDLIQFSWVALATFVILPLYLIFTYGMPDPAQLPANFLSVPFGTIPIVQFIVPSVLTFLLMHQSLLNQAPYWARSAGTRNLEVVKKGWIWTVIIAYVMGVIGAFIGCYVRQLLPDIQASQALGALLNIIPIPLAAIVMAGLMAATMSTCDIYLVSSVNQLIRDIAQYLLKIRDTEKLLKWATWGTIIFGLSAVLFAIVWQRGLSLLFAFGTAVGAPLFIFYLDSWLLKIGNGKGAVTAVIASLGTVLYWEILTNNYQNVHTLWLVFPVALVTLVVVSWLTKEEEVKAIPEGEMPSELGINILISVRKGYTSAIGIIDRLSSYCIKNGLQAGAVHKELDVLEKSGLIERESQRLIKQLYFRITPKGEKLIADKLSEEDAKLLNTQSIDGVELRVLQSLKSGPVALNVLAEELQLYTTELHAIVNRLNDKNLLRMFGFARIRMELTEQGSKIVNSLAS